MRRELTARSGGPRLVRSSTAGSDGELPARLRGGAGEREVSSQQGAAGKERRAAAGEERHLAGSIRWSFGSALLEFRYFGCSVSLLWATQNIQ